MFRSLPLLALAASGAVYSQSEMDAAPAPASASSRPSRFSAPVKVPPITVTPRAAIAPVAPAAASPSVAIPRPPVVGNCDAAGCWDSNGNRLNQFGPNLIGPRGVCTTLNGIVNCP